MKVLQGRLAVVGSPRGDDTYAVPNPGSVTSLRLSLIRIDWSSLLLVVSKKYAVRPFHTDDFWDPCSVFTRDLNLYSRG
jgi:hypothetical protein